MRILSFVGTRPEIIKNLALHRAAGRIPGLELLFFHTGQNSGEKMSECFFRELGLPVEKANESFDRSTPGRAAQSLLDFVVESVRAYAPAVVISNTDTTSAFYAALGAAALRVPVAHLEGGIRCEARHNPEEINRRLSDHLADWIFPIADGDIEVLRAEGLGAGRVFDLGDITLDALNIVLRENGIPVRRGDYDLLTTHRQENAGDPARLSGIIEGVARGGFRTVFPVHPRTRQALARPELAAILSRAGNVELREPQSYVEMTRLSAGCRKILTDSGGLRREGYMLGKPVISLVWFVWFKEMLRLGFKTVADADPERIAAAIRGFDPQGARPPIFGDGNAAERILRKIVELASR